MRATELDVIGTAQGWWKRIRQSGAVERARELTDAGAWASQAVDGVRTEQTRVREEFAELDSAWFAGKLPDASRTPRESYYHSLASRSCGLAGWCVTLLEAVFAGGLSILLLALPWYWAAAIGIAVTILLAIGLKGVFAPLVIGKYADRPKAGRDRALVLLMAVGPVALLLLAVVFVVRGLAGEWAAQWAFPLATAGLAIVCPVIAALLFVLAGLYGWSKLLTERYRGLEHAERQVAELREHCARALASPQRSGSGLLAKVGVAVLAAGLLTATACTRELHASTSSADRGGPQVSFMKDATISANDIGELWIDETVSVDARDRPVAYQAVLNPLLDASTRLGVRRWLVHGFGDEPWREAPFHRMDVPVWHAPSCDAPTEASQIFKAQRDTQVQQCEERVRAAERQHRQEFDKQIVAMHQALMLHQPDAARCTSIADLLQRVAVVPSRRLIVIISDGVETCRQDGLPRVTAPASDVQVTFVLVGSAPRSTRHAPTLGELFVARRDALVAAAPWLHVVTPWEVTTATMVGAEHR